MYFYTYLSTKNCLADTGTISIAWRRENAEAMHRCKKTKNTLEQPASSINYKEFKILK
jgi:hypothetical protein